MEHLRAAAAAEGCALLPCIVLQLYRFPEALLPSKESSSASQKHRHTIFAVLCF